MNEKTLKIVKSRLEATWSTCFLCKFILQDLSHHGKLTSWPMIGSEAGSGLFPRRSKVAHIFLEFVAPLTGHGIQVDDLEDDCEAYVTGVLPGAYWKGDLSHGR